ncbi:MAG: hypothetical protein M8357_02775 [Desulfobulbaceae bacterium]|nr:hypothetical protein [Desulfobulbaceae bacterium]
MLLRKQYLFVVSLSSGGEANLNSNCGGNMKRSRPITMFIVSLAVVFMASSVMAGAYYKNNNGASCRAATLNQAFDLAWDHARVYNPGTKFRWVICPVEMATDYAAADLSSYMYAADLLVYAWFGAGSDGSTPVTCIAREMDPVVIDTTPTNAVVHDIAPTGSAPEVVLQAFDASGWTSQGAGGTPGLILPFPATVTCRLPPGTGINAVRVSGGLETP